MCTAGSPKCDKCPCNFGEMIRRERFDEYSAVTMVRHYVKCAAWMGFRLAKAISSEWKNE